MSDKTPIPQHGLTETLETLVRRYGMRSVLRGLASIPEVKESTATTPRRTHGTSSTLSAVDYVRRMKLSSGNAKAMNRAAQYFDKKAFLPSIGDIREFCSIHNVELVKSSGRANSIPRVFKRLADMDADEITELLDDGTFSGPANLAPIADAIRDHTAERSKGTFRQPDIGR